MVMLFLDFSRLVLRKVFRKSVDTTDAVLLVGGALLAAFLELALGIEVIVNLPWWAVTLSVLGLVMLVRLLLAPYWIYVDFRKRNEGLSKTLDALETRESVRLGLARLRKKGVTIRNTGLKLTKKSEVPNWVRDADRWEKRVIKKIKEINRADAELFSTLDWVQFPEFKNTLSDGHHDTLRAMSQRLILLRELVVNYSRQAPIR